MGPWDDSTQRGFHDEWFDPGRVLVVLVKDEVAGVVDAHRSGDSTLYISRLELLSAFQGRGLGTRLMRQLIEDAREADLSAVELDVLQVNHRARRLYERLGFRVIRDEIPKQRMRLDVAAPSTEDGRDPATTP